MRKPEIAYSEWCDAIDKLVRDLFTSMHLPSELLAQVDMLKLEMARRQSELPKLGKLLLGILQTHMPPRAKCIRIIHDVGAAAGMDKFTCGMQEGVFTARLERMPEIERNLPSILQTGEVALKQLLK